MKGYLLIHYIPDRKNYQIIDNDVCIHFIIGGRHDMQTMLQERLLKR
jgi:hypothetical protein